jgi:uncharacterized protein (TIGR02453 family)
VAQPHFAPALFAFLEELRYNNERSWFQAHKERYRHEVQAPLLRFIEDFAAPLRSISRQFVADPRPIGGSMFRIQRDTRFSKDKSPYKTHAAAQFRHVRGKDVHAPGFYVHLAPGEVFFGAGIWHPDATALRAIRERIARRPDEWNKVVQAQAFRRTCQLEGERLKRSPAGFDPGHPLIEEIKRKDFVVAAYLDDRAALRADFLERFVGFCTASGPFVEQLTRAVGLRF